LIEGSVAMNDWHGAEPKPVVHAAWASARSVAAQALVVTDRTGVVTVDAQLP
jgi:hypothetical protein